MSAQTESYSPVRDLTLVWRIVEDYGVIKENRIQLLYFYKVWTLKCDWFDVSTGNSGLEMDGYVFTLVNITDSYPQMTIYSTSTISVLRGGLVRERLACRYKKCTT